ncbi:MAG: heme A synthase, partial [Verrucomicrobiaceae bacterium]|nr:heme A synthase [Verrucomicrobiaceae bacterium]
MNNFQKTALAALLATILLLFVGAIVRVSGSGLGCPDWPRCWGALWPPSSIEEV